MTNLSKERLLGRSVPINYLPLINLVLITASRFIYHTITDRDSEYVVVPILQMLIFVLPAMMFLWQKGSSSMSRTHLRIRFPKASHISIIASATVMLVTGGLLLSIIFGNIHSLRSNFSLYEAFVSKNGDSANNIYLVFAYALLPAVFEEMTYRSILCSEYETRGALTAIATSSLFYGILGLNLAMFPTHFFEGMILALTMYATRSVLCTISVHFLYNLFCIFTRPRVAVFYESTSSRGLFVILTLTILTLSVSLFCFSVSKLYLKYAKANKIPPYPTALTPKEHTSAIIETILNLPLILCVLIYVITAIIIR